MKYSYGLRGHAPPYAETAARPRGDFPVRTEGSDWPSGAPVGLSHELVTLWPGLCCVGVRPALPTGSGTKQHPRDPWESNTRVPGIGGQVPDQSRRLSSRRVHGPLRRTRLGLHRPGRGTGREGTSWSGGSSSTFRGSASGLRPRAGWIEGARGRRPSLMSGSCLKVAVGGDRLSHGECIPPHNASPQKCPHGLVQACSAVQG